MTGYLRIIRLALPVLPISQLGDYWPKSNFRTGHGVLDQWKSMQALACHEGIEKRRMCMHQGIMITKRHAMKSLWGHLTLPVLHLIKVIAFFDKLLYKLTHWTVCCYTASPISAPGWSREQLQVLLHNITSQNSRPIKDGDAGVTIRAFAFASSFSCKKCAQVAARVSQLWLA
jgi:hypothetical protein